MPSPVNLRRVIRSLGGNVTVTVERSTGFGVIEGNALANTPVQFSVTALIGPASQGDLQGAILQREDRGDTTRERLVMHTICPIDASRDDANAIPRPGDKILYDDSQFEEIAELDSQRQSGTHRCIISKLEGT